MPLIETHPILKPPKTNIKLWRYMEIPSFISLLSDGALVFNRADLFEDKYEGCLPKITAQELDLNVKELIKNGELHSGYEEFASILKQENEKIYLNCWSSNDYEMVHMWKIYSKENGIAIETDYDALKSSTESEEDIYPARIQYLDFNKDTIDWKWNTLSVFTIKKREYSAEKEFRLIISRPKGVATQRNTFYENALIVKCKVDISKLIKQIHF